MSDYKLTFKLKQHTPIIHFQHEQHGATLRASELKPKLDKFLIKKLGLTEIKNIGGKDQEIPKKEYSHLFNNKEKLSLDYKVKIVSSSEKIKGILSNKTYFGDMGHKGEKEYTWTDDIIDLSIFILDDTLGKEMQKYFPYFLAETNFGTRQNKGNGSFYLDKSDTQNFKQIENILPSGTFYFSISQKDDESIFKIVDYYYKRLKAGINLNFDARCTGEYQKSFLYQFYNGITKKGWEKRFIKEKFFGLYDDGNKKYFIRAFLGLSGGFTFKKTQEPCHKKANKRIKSSYEIMDDYEIEIYHPDIERYKSPITFKPIKYADKTKIFILTQENEHINTTKEFVLYKKFIVKKIFKLNRRLERKSDILPKMNGTQKHIIKNLVNELKKQEENIKAILLEIEKINNQKVKKGRTRYVEEYVIGQKQRFDDYLKECSEEDDKYIPPKCEIEIPNFVLDLTELIKKYNEDELKKSFAFENITATINVIK
jgi:hypothetical protein